MIHYTCRRCGCTMYSGQAFAPTSVAGLPDFPGGYEPSLHGQTMVEGHGVMVAVWKCSGCGHSVMAEPGGNVKPLPRIEGEVQRYQIGPDGDEWVKADDYAALNDYAALVQMERDMARAEVERLRALIKRARPYVQAYAAITRTDEVSLDASETAEAMRLSGPTTAERKEHGA